MNVKTSLAKTKNWLESINPDNVERVTPDLGDDTSIQRTGLVDKTVGGIADIDQRIANIGSGAYGASKGLSALKAPAAILKPLATTTLIASKFEPLQAALWGIDAGRALVDDEYRKKHLRAIEQLENDPKIAGKKMPNWVSPSVAQGVATGLLAFEHPIATGGALMRYWQGTRKMLKEIEAGKNSVDRHQSSREVPFVTPSTIKKEQAIYAASRMFNHKPTR
jgi:hypothetical protein